MGLKDLKNSLAPTGGPWNIHQPHEETPKKPTPKKLEKPKDSEKSTPRVLKDFYQLPNPTQWGLKDFRKSFSPTREPWNIHQPHEYILKKKPPQKAWRISIFEPHPMSLKDLKKSFQTHPWALKHQSAPRTHSEETHLKRPAGFISICELYPIETSVSPHEKTLKKPTPKGLKDFHQFFSITSRALKEPLAPRQGSEETHPEKLEGFPSIF